MVLSLNIPNIGEVRTKEGSDKLNAARAHIERILSLEEFKSDLAKAEKIRNGLKKGKKD